MGGRAAGARPHGRGWLTARLGSPAVGADEVAGRLPGRRRDGRRSRAPRGALARPRDRARARLRRDEAAALLAAADRRLGGAGGLLARLARFAAYSDPLAKKSQLFAKICERRGWLEVADPEHWEVSADNVLMRLALRSGLVEPGELDEVRAATRDAFKRVAVAAEVAPPLLDDLLWELGRDDPDLLGRAAGDLREPPRDPGSAWY